MKASSLKHVHLIGGAIVLLCLLLTHSSEAGSPSDTLRTLFGDANKILTDPATRQHPLDRLLTIQALVGRVFDFRDAAEHSLGGQWQASSTAEQAEFTRIFTEFMQRGFVYLLASVADVDGPGGGDHGSILEGVCRSGACDRADDGRRPGRQTDLPHP